MDFTIHHVAISAIDMTESVAFYEQFGFKIVLHWKAPDGELEIAHLKLGANYLEIFQYRDQTPAPETAGSLATDLPRIGVKHFALEVDSVQDHRDRWIVWSAWWVREPQAAAGRPGKPRRRTALWRGTPSG